MSEASDKRRFGRMGMGFITSRLLGSGCLRDSGGGWRPYSLEDLLQLL